MTSGSTEEQNLEGLEQGVDIVTDEISIEKAFTVFREFEEQDKVRPFKPPVVQAAEVGSAQELVGSRMTKDAPSLRIQRMKTELDDLENELKMLEQEQAESGLLSASEEMSGKDSIELIEKLHNTMLNAVNAARFEDTEKGTLVDLTKTSKTAKSKHNLLQAIQSMLAGKISRLDTEVAKGAQADENIELKVKMD